jgi:hypothetical protein
VRSEGNWLTRRHTKNMQKLGERNTYTPTDIPHIRGNCGLPLNREETLSVSGLKTSSNNSDAALSGFGSSETEPAGLRHKNSPLFDCEHDRRFVNPAATNARSTIPPPDKSGGLLYAFTPRYET